MPADLTKLDSTNLQQFIDGELKPFLDRIIEERRKGKTPPSLFDVSTMPRPLALGQMTGDSETGGETVLSNTVTAAGAIDKVLLKHESAIRDLQFELENVIKTMLKTQGDSLASIDGQKFLSAINDYTSEMDGGTGGGGTSTSDTKS
ncbi:type VII secretion system-associated protein [Streptomyces sp. NPDC004610]|uniref:type VII secretion system-associated protein n=1 Tax=unclassified Streptomyces TaxID=2593676 RepID=UPI0033A055FE